MRLHNAVLAAGLMAATVPSATIPAEAWGSGGYGFYPDCGYGYWDYGHVLIYSYGCGYPAYREHRYAFHRYIGRHVYGAVRGVRRARASKSTAAASSGAPATLGPSVASPSVASPSVASPSTSTVRPAPPANEPSTQVGSTVKELQQAKVDAINARASESMAQHKLADTEANLKQAKDEATQATQEAEQAKADAQAERQSAEANLKQARDQAAQAAREAVQAKADAQAARQSKVEAERKLAKSEAARTATEEQTQSQTDPLGTWLRGLGTRWLQGLRSWLRRWGLVS
jgi:cell division septum initiation protein DivIVA